MLDPLPTLGHRGTVVSPLLHAWMEMLVRFLCIARLKNHAAYVRLCRKVKERQVLKFAVMQSTVQGIAFCNAATSFKMKTKL